MNGFPFGCFLGVFTSLEKKKKKTIHFSLKESFETVGETDTAEICVPACWLPAP